MSDLAQAPPPDVVIVAVKTYSLDKVGALLKEKLGDAPLILALQNGVDNQTILPKYFSKVVYGVVSYNAWIDEPGVVGYQKRGPLVLGTPDGGHGDEARALAALLSRGVETVVTDHFQDAAYSKMVINLTNSLQALIGHPLRPIGDRALFQRVLTNLTWEGVQIVARGRASRVPPGRNAVVEADVGGGEPAGVHHARRVREEREEDGHQLDGAGRPAARRRRQRAGDDQRTLHPAGRPAQAEGAVQPRRLRASARSGSARGYRRWKSTTSGPPPKAAPASRRRCRSLCGRTNARPAVAGAFRGTACYAVLARFARCARHVLRLGARRWHSRLRREALLDARERPLRRPAASWRHAAK